MTAFVTVGSTKFDLLVESVLSVECLGALERRGYETLIIQYGNSQLPTVPQSKVSITAYKFKQSLAQDITQADIVISHAGSGTIVDALRASKPLIVVPNNTLMDDHQSELANELCLLGYLFTCSAGYLASTISEVDLTKLKPFPAQHPARFQDLMDEEMGFM